MANKKINLENLSETLAKDMINSIKNTVGEAYTETLKGAEIDIESELDKSIKKLKKWFKYNYGE